LGFCLFFNVSEQFTVVVLAVNFVLNSHKETIAFVVYLTMAREIKFDLSLFIMTKISLIEELKLHSDICLDFILFELLVGNAHGAGDGHDSRIKTIERIGFLQHLLHINKTARDLAVILGVFCFFGLHVVITVLGVTHV
jgi:hypothetical protein